MILRLTIQPAEGGLRAEISRRDDLGRKLKGGSQVFLVATKQDAKEKARAAARRLGLKTYRVVDKA